MLVEVGVLGGQHGVDDMAGETPQLDGLALLLAQSADDRAVGSHHLAGLGQVVEAADGGGERGDDGQDDAARCGGGRSPQGRHGDHHQQGEQRRQRHPSPAEVADGQPPQRESFNHPACVVRTLGDRQTFWGHR